MHRDSMEEMWGREERVLETLIPYSSDVERMGVTREPVICSRPRSMATQRYLLLWEELKRVAR
jgi:chromosome partitioning protein